ncbi:MAG: T9SS type A sorting domain-containing protein [Saprospiraceae bacterium]|nr:T9SS type A sorting domain-containing protein [Saprospiraceae bacterium]
MQFLIKFYFILLFVFQTFMSFTQSSIIVINGGIFGSSNYANITIENLSNGSLVCIDTIYTNSIQDVLVDGQYLYVAAQDSIVKYDLNTQNRVAATAFGSISTVKMGIHGSKLLVGNYYEPWGWSGPFNNHFRIFNTSDLSFVDSIPQVSKAAKDFVVQGDYVYIAQNNSKTVGWGDTLGYLAVVDLNNLSFVRYDTLSGNGDEIGRLVTEGNMLYSLNGSSNTISSYNTLTGAKSTIASNVDLNPLSIGPTAFNDGNGVWYFPFDSGIGSYNLGSNMVVNPNLINITGSFSFVFDTIDNHFYVSHIDFANQGNNKGIIYNMTGDSVGIYQVGFSPEAMAIISSTSVSVSKFDEPKFNFSFFPNPVRSVMNVQMTFPQEVSVMILNQLGQIVIQEKTNAKNFSLSLNQLQQGVYYITITTKEGVLTTHRFIKKE